MGIQTTHHHISQSLDFTGKFVLEIIQNKAYYISAWRKVVYSGKEWNGMFMGEYSHNIDAKGRLIVPAKFREQLGSEFVVTKGLDGCLYVYSNEEWKGIEETFRSISRTGKEARKFTRFFFAGAATMELDKQGRILLPQVLREYAGLKKDVVLLGVLNRIEIWDRDRLDQDGGYDDMDDIAEHMAELGLAL